MKRLLQFIKWLFILVLLSIVVLMVGIESYDRHISTDKGTRYIYRKTPYAKTLEIHKTKSGIRYITLGHRNKPNLLLIHGAPGGVIDFVRIAKDKRIYNHYRLIIVERPGYGGTTPNQVEKSILKQAQRISEVLEQEGKAVVLGHSYGGPVAITLAAIYPSLVQSVVGAAGQYNPDDEVIFSISYFIKAPIFQSLLPRWLWVSNEEKLSHQKAQEEILPLYSKINVPVTLIHGDADELVPYNNSVFLMKKLTTKKKKLITLKGEKHPFHIQKPKILVDFLTSGNLNP